MLWNTVYLERAANALRGHGQAVDDALLQYLSPLGWEHINLTGDYLWRSSAKIGAGKFRPLRPLSETTPSTHRALRLRLAHSDALRQACSAHIWQLGLAGLSDHDALASSATLHRVHLCCTSSLTLPKIQTHNWWVDSNLK